MPYPNVGFWSALQNGRRIDIDKSTYVLSVVTCGDLVVSTGKLVAADPFVFLQEYVEDPSLPGVQVPPGRYPVAVTLADVSGLSDGSHMREAYVTLSLRPGAEEVRRRIITPVKEGETCEPELAVDNTFCGFPVDAGTVCFVDAGSLALGMPPVGQWGQVFDDGSPASWFAQMDDPNNIRAGLANITLPLAKAGENIVLAHSGWGDGIYPVIGGYDAAGALVAVHVDLMVVFDESGT